MLITTGSLDCKTRGFCLLAFDTVDANSLSALHKVFFLKKDRKLNVAFSVIVYVRWYG